MTITEEQRKDFEALARPLMEWLSNFHPHVNVTVSAMDAELAEGVAAFETTEYLKD